MQTQCNNPILTWEPLGTREVVASFDGQHITSDAGGLLLREVEAKFRFLEQFSLCFSDFRDPDLIEHTVTELLKQRVFGLCLGYEDLNDHDQLRHDPLLAVLAGKTDPMGHNRLRQRDRGKALAGKSTLNRLELTPVKANAKSRYKKIAAHLDRMQGFFVEAFLQQHAVPPARIVLDLDSTDFPLHGHQLGRFFHGYYDCYCYLPLYIFCGDHPLLALLRPSSIDNTAGVLKHLARIIGRIRQAWPDVVIVVRADSGFCRDHLMRWCEAQKDVKYLFGLAKNKRLQKLLQDELLQAEQQFLQTRQPARIFKDFCYSTLDSWSCERRVVGKAEHLDKGTNPRFVVTSLTAAEFAAGPLYEQEYCARGDMENRIKEQQLMLFANRVSCATMRANQVRLCLSTVAYIVMRALREFGLGESEPSVSAAVPTASAEAAEAAVATVPVAVVEAASAATAMESAPVPALPVPAAVVEGVSAMAAVEAVRAAAVGAASAAAAMEPASAPAEAASGRTGDAGCGHRQVMEPAPVPAEAASAAVEEERSAVAGVEVVRTAAGEAARASDAPAEPAAAEPADEGDLQTRARMARPVQAQCDTIRLRLLKIGAVIRVSVRRIWVSMSEAYPFRAWFTQVWERLQRLRVSASGLAGRG